MLVVVAACEQEYLVVNRRNGLLSGVSVIYRAGTSMLEIA